MSDLRVPGRHDPVNHDVVSHDVVGHDIDCEDEKLTLRDRVEKLTFAMEKMNLSEYITLLRHPGRLMWVNFIAGSARGLGIAFGFAVLSALLLYLLQAVMWAKLPVIGDFIATVVRLVDHNLQP